MSFYQLLASFSEAFMRLAQTRERGCLLVFNAQEAIHLFVENGVVVHAAAGKLAGTPALDRAFELKGSSYGWIPGAEPASKDIDVDMQEYMHKNSIGLDQRFGKTIRMSPLSPSRKFTLDFVALSFPPSTATSTVCDPGSATIRPRSSTEAASPSTFTSLIVWLPTATCARPILGSSSRKCFWPN